MVIDQSPDIFDHYYLRYRGRVVGPYYIDVVRRMVRLGQLSRVSEVSMDQITWRPAGEFPELWSAAAQHESKPLGPPQLPSLSVANTLATVSPPQLPLRVAGSGGTNGSSPSFRGFKSWGAVAALLMLGMALVILLIFILTGNNSPSTAPNDGHLYAGLSKSVGKVVVGLKGTVDIRELEVPCIVGSAFLVSSEGYYLTNKHVVATEDTENGLNWDPIKMATWNATMSRKYRQDIRMQPKVWIVINEEKLLSRVVFQSDTFDLAVLKASCIAGAKPLPLSTRGEFVPPLEVLAAGFPGINDEPLSFEEAVNQKIAESGAKRIESYFPERSFTLDLTKGIVNMTMKPENQPLTIKHQAKISPGNSGGPLLDLNGTVLGINTSVKKNKQREIDAGYSPIISQMRSEIDRYAPGATWLP